MVPDARCLKEKFRVRRRATEAVYIKLTCKFPSHFPTFAPALTKRIKPVNLKPAKQ